MTKTITLEGDITAVDTATELTTQGSVTLPSKQIPAGATKIDKIIVAIATAIGGAGSAAFLLRLGGGGVQKGEQTLVIGAAGYVANQAGSDGAPMVMKPKVFDDCDIDVAANNTLKVQVEMMGTDLGTAEVVVTLIFK